MESAFDSKKLLDMKLLCSEINTINETGMPNFLTVPGGCAMHCPLLCLIYVTSEKKIVRILTVESLSTLISATVSRKGKSHLPFHPLLKTHHLLPYLSIAQVTVPHRSTNKRDPVTDM